MLLAKSTIKSLKPYFVCFFPSTDMQLIFIWLISLTNFHLIILLKHDIAFLFSTSLKMNTWMDYEKMGPWGRILQRVKRYAATQSFYVFFRNIFRLTTTLKCYCWLQTAPGLYLSLFMLVMKRDNSCPKLLHYYYIFQKQSLQY